MYDVANGVFYTNKGTGTFNKGEDIYELPKEFQKVEYVSSNTTTGQYIDTEIIPSYANGMKIKIDFAPSTLGVRYGLLASYNQGNGQASLEIMADNKLRVWLDTGKLDVKSTNTVTTSRNSLYLEYKNSSYYFSLNGTVVKGTYTTTSVPDYGMFMFLDRAKRTTTFTKPLKIYRCTI